MKQIMKKIIHKRTVLLVFLTCFLILPANVWAASGMQDGLSASIVTDKAEYSAGESILVTIDIANQNTAVINNISAAISLPEGFHLAESVENPTILKTIEAGQKETVSFELLSDTNHNVNESTSENKSETTETKTTETKTADTKTSSVKTGDDTNISKPLILLCISTAFITVILILKKKHAARLLSVILCVAVLGGSIPVTTAEAASQTEKKTLEITESVKINETTSDIVITITYDWTSETDETGINNEQTIPEEVAKLYGIDPNDYDTDQDGLSNYVEIYITQTDPTTDDSDGNGVPDSDEDLDGDGLSNAEEIYLGTEPDKTDTDKDGISDYDEINLYHTDPLDYDSDDDSLCDGDELILGLDPLLAKTDGVTLDSERKFTQELSEENIAEPLSAEESEAVPSLTLNISGNINKNVMINETSSGDFTDSRAIVGNAIDVTGENITEGTLRFSLNDGGIALLSMEDSFNTNDRWR